MTRSRRAWGLLAVVGCLWSVPASAAPPKLVVMLVVDQMRADYIEWYGASWKGGLRRMIDRGAWLTNARYPYLETVTCAGHATIGTGSYPHTHGMVLNAWYDPVRKKPTECTADPAAPLLGYAPGATRGGDSAKNLLAPTLGDEMREQLSTKTQVAALSMKARSAISLGGHKPDLALWFDGARWVTSTAFTTTPAQWVVDFAKENPIAASLATPWTRALSDNAYKYEDDAPGEHPGAGWSRTFPHPLADADASVSLTRWTTSPAADDYLERLAEAALVRMKLGQGRGTDLLAVSFSMTDIVGHHFGPRSHEVQDVLARLDATLGKLLDALDAQVGPGDYTVALTADHGVALIPEQAKATGVDAGRIVPAELARRVDAAIATVLGAGQYVADVEGNDVYLAPGVHDRLRAKPGAIEQVVAATRAIPGVADAFDSSEVASVAKARGATRKAAALSYYPGRSGDLLFAPRPNWVVGANGTNHGTTHDYDQRVPVLFYGKGVRAGRYGRASSPADVAPTLAHLLGIKMPKAEGKVVAEVVAAPARRP